MKRALARAFACALLSSTACFDAPYEASDEELALAQSELVETAQVQPFTRDNFRGATRKLRVADDDLISASELRDSGLRDSISSALLTGVPRQASAFFFQRSDGTGRFLQVTGDGPGVVSVPRFAKFGMDDKTSMIWLVDHGTASLRLSRSDLSAQVEANAALLAPKQSNASLRSASLQLLPASGLLSVRTVSKISLRVIKDKTARVTVRMRPVIEQGHVRFVFAGLSQSISQCWPRNPVCQQIKRSIKEQIGKGRALEEAFNRNLGALLDPVFDAAAKLRCRKGSVRAVRVNTTPEFLEIVVAQTQQDLGCLESVDALLPTALTALLSKSRPPAQLHASDNAP